VDQPDCPYNNTSVDLRLAPRLSIPEKGPYTFDLRHGGIAKFLGENSREVVIDPAGGFSLQPHQFVLGQTLEYIDLPIPEREGIAPLSARIEGRSSFARCGLLVHFTAPTVHAGFSGQLTLEMINLGRSPITLYSEQPICQLILELVESLPFDNPSQFQGQSSPPGTR
jgi:dCTP deaminase